MGDGADPTDAISSASLSAAALADSAAAAEREGGELVASAVDVTSWFDNGTVFEIPLSCCSRGGRGMPVGAEC